MDARKAYEHYLDPANLVPAGPAERPRRAARLSAMVPVRFRPEVIAAVRDRADTEGVTASAWIRQVVDRALERPAGLVLGSGTPGEPAELPSSLAPQPIGWSCPHLTITSTPGALGKPVPWCGCEMQPVYATAAAG